MKQTDLKDTDACIVRQVDAGHAAVPQDALYPVLGRRNPPKLLENGFPLIAVHGRRGRSRASSRLGSGHRGRRRGRRPAIHAGRTRGGLGSAEGAGCQAHRHRRA